MMQFIRKAIHALMAAAIIIVFGVWLAFHLDYWVFPQEPDHYVKMFEKPHREKFSAALFDIKGSYWPECVNFPTYGGELFAPHGWPCLPPEIGFMDGPQIKGYLHWRPGINPQDKMYAIEFLKRNGIHYDGDDNVNFKKGVKP